MKKNIKFILIDLLIVVVALSLCALLFHTLYMVKYNIDQEQIKKEVRIKQEIHDGTIVPTWYGYRYTKLLEQEQIKQEKLKTRLLEKQLEEQCQ